MPTAASITGNDPADTSVAIDARLCRGLGQPPRRPATARAANGGVAYYNLDNEPMLWNSTHRDVHPAAGHLRRAARPHLCSTPPRSRPPTRRPRRSARCCGAGAPTSIPPPTAAATATDYQTHGNIPFVPWYLQQMQAYEQQHGVRILDYLDLHYYPQANGVVARQRRQCRHPGAAPALHPLPVGPDLYRRKLDLGYARRVAVRLIPRMREWVAANYPGTKLAITEYNWGGLEHINGALAQADVLGIFGREGLDLATLWGPPASNQPGAFAFRMYRNYDGAGHGFGDISVAASQRPIRISWPCTRRSAAPTAR